MHPEVSLPSFSNFWLGSTETVYASLLQLPVADRGSRRGFCIAVAAGVPSGAAKVGCFESPDYGMWQM